jgi:hypothetical protein
MEENKMLGETKYYEKKDLEELESQNAIRLLSYILVDLSTSRWMIADAQKSIKNIEEMIEKRISLWKLDCIFLAVFIVFAFLSSLKALTELLS